MIFFEAQTKEFPRVYVKSNGKSRRNSAVFDNFVHVKQFVEAYDLSSHSIKTFD